jgi:hypothetical protein
VSERARHFAQISSAATAESVETHVARESAEGARVFRIEQVAVVDPVTHAHYIALRDRVKQTAAGIVIFMGSRQIVLSPEAKIVTTDSYGYLFRHGAERDPDPSLHALRIK